MPFFILGLTGGTLRLPECLAPLADCRSLPPAAAAPAATRHSPLLPPLQGVAGIAMGKSTVAQWMRELGVPVLDSDQVLPPVCTLHKGACASSASVASTRSRLVMLPGTAGCQPPGPPLLPFDP